MSALLFAMGVVDDDSRTPREKNPVVRCLDDELLPVVALPDVKCRACGGYLTSARYEQRKTTCEACMRDASKDRANAKRRERVCPCGRRAVDGATCGRRVCR
jgi:hypothetical protein